VVPERVDERDDVYRGDSNRLNTPPDATTSQQMVRDGNRIAKNFADRRTPPAPISAPLRSPIPSSLHRPGRTILQPRIKPSPILPKLLDSASMETWPSTPILSPKPILLLD